MNTELIFDMRLQVEGKLLLADHAFCDKDFSEVARELREAKTAIEVVERIISRDYQ